MTAEIEKPAFYAMALQITCRAVNKVPDRAAAQAVMTATLDHLDGAIAGAKRFHGPDLALVVVPEYFLTSHPMGESIAEWKALACIDPDGPEYVRMGAIAQKHGVYLSGNAYETDAHFPDLYFQTSFLIDPSGAVVLRYRRLISMFAPSPYDVLDRYLEIYGAEGLFPVAATPLGRFAAIASEEILYPEIARILALRGAEVFLHSSSEAATGDLSIKNIAKRARAIENLAYVVSANSAGIEDSLVLAQSTEFGSKIVDYKGKILVEAGYGETINAFAEVDLGALRRYRRRPGMGNMLARQPVQLYARALAGLDVAPANGLLKDGGAIIPDRSFFVSRQRDVIARLAEAGLI